MGEENYKDRVISAILSNQPDRISDEPIDCIMPIHLKKCIENGCEKSIHYIFENMEDELDYLAKCDLSGCYETCIMKNRPELLIVLEGLGAEIDFNRLNKFCDTNGKSHVLQTYYMIKASKR